MPDMDATHLREVLADPVAQRLYDSVELTRLAYTAKDGSPRVIPIGYRFNGAKFLVFTVPNAAKVPALTADPRVALTVDTDIYPPNLLLVRGTAAIEIVDGVPSDYLETNRKRTSEEEFRKWEAGVRRLYTQMARITVTPTWAKILDFETRIPSAVEELVHRQGAEHPEHR